MVSNGTNFLVTGKIESCTHSNQYLLSMIFSSHCNFLLKNSLSILIFNFVGVVSGLILGEKVNGRWYAGAVIIATGVCLIALSQHSKRTE